MHSSIETKVVPGFHILGSAGVAGRNCFWDDLLHISIVLMIYYRTRL